MHFKRLSNLLIISLRIFLLFEVSMCYLGEVEQRMEEKLKDCISTFFDYRSTFHSMMRCYTVTLYTCHGNPDSTVGEYITSQSICGVLKSGELTLSTSWNICVDKDLNIFVEFLHFNLPCSARCDKASLELILDNSTELLLCGNRMPLGESFDSSEVEIIYTQRGSIYAGFSFVIRFEAIDAASPGLINVYKYAMIDHFDRPNLLLKSFSGNKYCCSDIYMIYFTTFILHRMCLKGAFLKYMTIYDGPGPLSNTLAASNGTYCFTSFQGYLENKQDLAELLLGKINPDSLVGTLNWTSNFSDSDQHLCGEFHQDQQMQMTAKSSPREVIFCKWKIHPKIAEMVLQRLIFEGVNALQDKLSHDVCHYGGLFITNDRKQEHSFCTSIHQLTPFPLKTEVTYDNRFIVFVSFPKYTSGMVRVQASSEPTKCVHYNLVLCNSWYMFNFKLFSKGYFNISHETSLEVCSVMWMIPVDFTIDLACFMNVFPDVNIDEFLNQQQRVEISNNIIPLTPYIEDPWPESYYQFNMTLSTFLDFPISKKLQHKNIMVDRFQQVTYDLTFMTDVHFQSNLFENNKELYFPFVRIEFTQLRICNNLHVEHSTDQLEQAIYLNTEFLKSAGFHSCKMKIYNPYLIQSHLLNSSDNQFINVSSNSIRSGTKNRLSYRKDIGTFFLRTTDGYPPCLFCLTHEDFVLSFHLTISRTPSCLSCVLDVTLVEKEIDSGTMRTLTWNNVTMINQDFLPNTHFSLHIAQICETLTLIPHVCSTEIILKKSSPWYTLSAYLNNPIKYTSDTYYPLSWFDADAECERKGLSLLTATDVTSGQLITWARQQVFNNEQVYHQVIFAKTPHSNMKVAIAIVHIYNYTCLKICLSSEPCYLISEFAKGWFISRWAILPVLCRLAEDSK